MYDEDISAVISTGVQSSLVWQGPRSVCPSLSSLHGPTGSKEFRLISQSITLDLNIRLMSRAPGKMFSDCSEYPYFNVFGTVLSFYLIIVQISNVT